MFGDNLKSKSLISLKATFVIEFNTSSSSLFACIKNFTIMKYNCSLDNPEPAFSVASNPANTILFVSVNNTNALFIISQ